ncbi:MAG: LysE family translocator [Alphaproteobacteria bacterium]|jgi:threonine/homoserine/homoserine lactone efflux protein|nr:LysE family translocator [Alphaproteobacteria bacterium]
MPLDPELYGAFLVVALAAILSPGPDTLLVIRATLGGGHGHGFAALLGVQIGLLGHLAAAVFGLSLVLLAVPLALKGVALAGALYLCWLGYRNIRAAAERNMAGEAGLAPAGAASAAAICRDAILTNLLNPKVILLFIALMPGFVAPGRASIPVQLALLGASIILLNILWQGALVLAAGRARRWLARARVQRGIALASGLVFIAFAVLMLVEFVAAPL